MKIRNLNELEEKIDVELAWRKKELTSIKIDVDESEKKVKVNSQKRLELEL